MTNDKMTDDGKFMTSLLVALKDGVLHVGGKSFEPLMKSIDDFMVENDVDAFSGIAALIGIAAIVAAAFDIDSGMDQLNEGADSSKVLPAAFLASPAFFNATYQLAIKAAANNVAATILDKALRDANLEIGGSHTVN